MANNKNSSKSNNNKSTSSTPTPTPTPPLLPLSSTSSSTSTPSTKDLSTLLNLSLRLTLVGGENPRIVEGVVFTYDPLTTLLVLITPSTSPLTLPSTPRTSQNPPVQKRSYHLIKSSEILSLKILSLVPDTTLFPPLDSLKKVNLKELEAKVEKAVREDQKERSRIGVGVTVEGQALFDALGRTLPVRWSGSNIVVMDEVIINFPYSINDVKGAAGKGERVERVKKVLEGERRRLSVV